MQELISLLDANVLYTFLLLLARVLAFLVFMPIFSHTSVSPTIRIAVAFYLTIFLYPLITVQSSINESNFLGAILSEITLGLIASFFVNIVFSSVKIIGEFVGYATALSMANMFDPASGSQEGVVSRFLYIISILIFFETGMYEVTIVMLAKSFTMVTLGDFNLFTFDGIKIAIEEINRMFAFAFAFAFPLFFIGFIMDIYYGYGTKSMPAFSPFVITFQLKFALIFLFLMFGMDVFVEKFNEYFINKFM